MKKTRIDNGIFITMDEGNPVVHGTMIIEGNRIAYIGGAPEGEFGETEERIDGKGKVFLPGFVNTHSHAAMSLLRGYGDDMALQLWLQEKMWPMEAKFTAGDVRSGTLLSILEMVKGGTTTFVDMYDHMNEVAKAVQESGLRACLTRGVIGLCPRDVQDAKLEEAVRFAKDWHQGADGRITAMMSPHAPYTCPPDYIERIVAAAHDLDLPIHTHMSETAREVQENVDQYGARPVAHLEKLGVFTRPTLLAHGVHLTDEEIGTLKQYDVRVSHNPNSNLKLASGVARVPELMKAGVLVSLGTDGAASNNNLDMLEEIRLAALIHKGVSGDPVAVPAWDALKLGTADGARSIWLEDVGVLKEGCKADFIAMDIDQPHFFPRTNLVSHVVYSASSRDVTDVCIDGKWIVRNRECLTLDEEKIMHEAQACFERLTSG
ncbi:MULTISPECIES: amidohydrolase [Paenibacillus]|uniref:amidohydrolase n=1 Tax=Paenibacillus TaxID=44249 RepID=UPI0022B8FDD6|nr:amidohydrolase [Paenibacillus caseinilyticus]MCZ8521411.1 amidohydrolase [Paenibacillus caseinilyticus]